MRVRGGIPIRVNTGEQVSSEDANWSPDGKEIVFCSNPWRLGRRQERVEIKVLNLKTHAIASLPADGHLYSPRWSPDGRYILARPIDKQSLQVFDLETHRWKTLSTGGNPEWPVWSHDGQFVYFHRLGAGSGEGFFRISVASGAMQRVADSTGLRETGMFGQWFGLDRSDSPIVLRDVGSNELYALTLERR